MNQTANLGLNLPEESDWAEVATLNENWEKVDEAVAKKAELGADGKIPAEQLPEMNYDKAGSAEAVQKNLDAHTGNKSNPHGVTASQVGARADTWVPSWSEVSGKPGTFPPSGHNHDAANITSGTLPVVRGGTGVNNLDSFAQTLHPTSMTADTFISNTAYTFATLGPGWGSRGYMNGLTLTELVRRIMTTYSTVDLVAGSSPLETNKLYFVYE